MGTWLEQNERDLRSLGEGETDAQGLKGRLDEHRKVHGSRVQPVVANTDGFLHYERFFVFYRKKMLKIIWK